MQAWQSIIGALSTTIVIGCVFCFLFRTLRNRTRGKYQVDMLVSSTGGSPTKSISTSISSKKTTINPVTSTLPMNQAKSVNDLEAVEFIKKRQDEELKRTLSEHETSQMIAEREADLDRDLAQWLETEQAEITRTAAMQAVAEEEQRRQTQARTIASTQAVLKWADQTRADVPDIDLIWSKTAKTANANIAEAKKQIISASEIIDREAQDLEYVITRLETGVDFISMEVRETINRWKKGEIHRRSTLDDLKRKFRLKTYSIDDGWELFFIYPDWLAKQRAKLFDYVILLGAKTEKTANILTVLESAEKTEWEKNLDMDMDVLFLLKEIKKMHQTMLVMDNRLKELESACKKRSEQVISPSWEPRGIL
jgi:hypothetical protein